LIEQYKPKYYKDLLFYFNENKDLDFYLIENGYKKYINNHYDVKNLIKSTRLFISKDEGKINGIFSLRKVLDDFSGERVYLKINSNDANIVEKLFTYLFWFLRKDLYIIVHKRSKYLDILRDKHFRFVKDNGKELVLVRPYIGRTENGNNHFGHRD
jgi:hypothetical protein